MQRVVQANRAIAVHTPLGQDKLLLTGFTGREAISQLYRFELDLLATNATVVPFDKLLGQPITMEMSLPSGKKRFFSGIVSRMSEGARDEEFTHFWVEMVPQLWLLTKRSQSRIFQQKTVIDILKQVFNGLEVEFETKGRYHERNYCVQYRESDFEFASRLMEEEGIYYYFEHTADRHVMVVADTPHSHPDVPERSRLIFEEVLGGNRPEDRITEWERVQEIRSSKVSLWDHTFELPRQHLEGERQMPVDVAAGRGVQKLKLLAERNLEIHEFPGEFAKRFDGVSRGGADRPNEMPLVGQDGARTTAIRMEQEAVPGLVINGSGTCRQLVSGHKFTLERHHNADGTYLITSVSHTAQLSGNFRAGAAGTTEVLVDFTCIPIGVPFRPVRKTHRPLIHGTQTAYVVGPAGHEVFTDKYGRVKVQFHWDREGRSDADSSCWVRVAQVWAGKRWGASFWPRIGQEVVVAFENGDPDAPIIVGSVYNAEQMPPYLGNSPDYKHKFDNRVSGIKTCSTPGGNGFNELRFDDTKDKEQVFLHAQCQKDERVGGDSLEYVGNDRHMIVDGNQMEKVAVNKNITVEGDFFELICGSEVHTVFGNQDNVVVGTKMETIDADFGFHCYGHVLETIDSFKHVCVGGDLEQAVKGKFTVDAGKEMHFKSPENIVIESESCITLRVGGSYVQVTAAGVDIFGPEIWLNCDGAVGEGGVGCGAGAAADAKEADPAAPCQADGAMTGLPSAPDAKIASKPQGKPAEKKGKGAHKKHEPPFREAPKTICIPPTGGLQDHPPICYPDEPNDSPPRIPATGGL